MSESQVHGHEVMQMMIESAKPYTRESLRQAMVERFGDQTTYFTCSAHDMSPDELIDFLASRGKFVDAGDGFQTDPGKICNH